MGPGDGAVASAVAVTPLWRQQDRQVMGFDRCCGRVMGYVVRLYFHMVGNGTGNTGHSVINLTISRALLSM